MRWWSDGGILKDVRGNVVFDGNVEYKPEIGWVRSGGVKIILHEGIRELGDQGMGFVICVDVEVF